jgi:palmitoyl-protein thioesterase
MQKLHKFITTGSHFLADLNNFKAEKNPQYKEALERLANFVMIMWEEDQTIIPPISSHMGFYRLGQDNVTVPLQVYTLYKAWRRKCRLCYVH